jgi:hypothetical protein
MAKIGEVNLYWTKLNIYGFTGTVVDKEQSITTTVVPVNNAGNFTTRTDQSTHLYLRGADGVEKELEFETRTGFRVGHTATFVVASKTVWDKGHYVAVYNNSTGQNNTFRRGNNRMACFPFYTTTAILAIIVGAIGITISIIFPVLAIAYIGFMLWCQLRLKRQVAELMRDYQPAMA